MTERCQVDCCIQYIEYNSLRNGRKRKGRDLLYMPIVLACGHISCFWCTHTAMHGLRATPCTICRRRYNHFPSICKLLHLLLQKMVPAAYKSREKEILEEEITRGCFSPQFVDYPFSETVDVVKYNSATLEEIEISADNLKVNKNIALDENNSPQNGPQNEFYEQISVADVLCAGCNELLYRPSVLNCGHVYCESCVPGLVNGPLKCQICQSLHPGDFPNVCWELENFTKENNPKEYTIRRESVQLKKIQCQHGDPSLGALETREHNAKFYFHAEDDNLWLNEDFSKAHIAVGCDSCGMYPIIGKRYKCRDCREKVGYDLCEVCYSNNNILPGRFNQRHAPDHRFELDDSRMLSKLLMLRAMLSVELDQDLPEGDREDHVNLDSVSGNVS